MEKTRVELPEIKLVGIQVRTSLMANMDPEGGDIAQCVQKYMQEGIARKIPNRKKPDTTLCAYTDYESDYMGDYTYFIGEEVTSTDNMPEGLSILTIPAQTYVKFTNGPNAMPDVCIEAWQEIWEMSAEELGGERNYHTDFEVYDERAADFSNATLDVLVGIS